MSLFEQVDEILQQLRPFLLRDGGDCELVDVTEEGVVEIKLLGACGSCPSSSVTLYAGIERSIRDELPEVSRVIQVF
jgi:Fe-S cluster biogenesis protein NfuA